MNKNILSVLDLRGSLELASQRIGRPACCFLIPTFYQAPMDRKSMVLAALASGEGQPYSPVQIQKMMFILDKEVSSKTGGPHFRFRPYDYGPFDKAVYDTLEELATAGKVEILDGPMRRYKMYKPTERGLAEGRGALGKLSPTTRTYIAGISEFVRRLTFAELVQSIYKAYPDMKANSVFRTPS